MNIASFIALLRDLLRKALGLAASKEDQIWKQWFELKDRTSTDLNGLLLSNVAEPYKLRALTVLLAKKRENIPEHWWYPPDHRNQVNEFWRPSFEQLPDVLIQSAAEIVCEIMDRGQSGAYEDEILRLLALLPENDPLAQKLFDRFELNDRESCNGPGYASGYNPFMRLMRDHANIVEGKIANKPIPHKWKWFADAKMRKIVESEVRGLTTPREPHEDALACYADAICPCGGPLVFSDALALSQAYFVVGIAPSTEGIDDALCFWYRRFDKPVRRDLRIAIARLFAKDSRHRWLHEDIVRLMATEFCDHPEIADPLNAFLEERRRTTDKNQAIERQMTEKEQSVLSLMSVATA
jgi:hypothetical protein